MADEVPVPVSDGEGDGAGSPKLPRIGVGEAAQRGSRRREGGGAVTLDDLNTLLGQQSASLAESQARAIKGAVAELRAATAAELQGVKAELSRHADYISQLRDQNERLEARMLAVETQKSEGSTVFPGSHGGDAGHQKNLVILGGWDADTHKADLLPELEDMLDRIGVRGQFQDIFTTGPRRGHAMGLVKWPPGESEQDLKKRLIKLVQDIRGASMASTSMPNGKTLWAALSKSKMERLRAGHAGKTKRLILEVNVSEKHAMDVEWGAGSVWMRSQLVASAVRAPPRGAVVKQGKAPGMWVDVPQIARMLGTSGESLGDRWDALIAE